ncbi:hypothetical protein RUM43_012278 [Polyplax serrata]|uniref:Uncharacterized protein n=1 Tax=Polyplax serrata TaxID=468196 RepID=A0AAN8NRZ6_POLSC
MEKWGKNGQQKMRKKTERNKLESLKKQTEREREIKGELKEQNKEETWVDTVKE